jgi:UDP-glucose 4-epimerase
MKKVVVFGGSGFLGSYVADELSSRGYQVVIADIQKSRFLAEGQEFTKCDIMQPKEILDAMDGASVAYNFAGLSDLDESINLPRETIEQNVIGNINVLEACKAKKIERFVYASSAYALSTKGSFYGISKLTSEKVVEEYLARFGVPYSIIRYGSLYGERADHHNGVYRLLRSALENQEVLLQGDGDAVREYIHAGDAAKLSVDIIEVGDYVNQHMVLTGVERLRHKDIVAMIQEILDNNIEVTYAGESWEGHYQVTPHSYHPTVARKMVANTFIELGQGLISCIRHIDEEINGGGPPDLDISD